MKHAALLLLAFIASAGASCTETSLPSDTEPVQITETTPVLPVRADAFPTQIDPMLADRFSRLALDCVQQEFPNKISRTTNTAEAIGRPRDLFPAFYGCFDWHSAVHGHWLLVRLLRIGDLEAETQAEAIAKLNANLNLDTIAGELANFRRAERGSWERPYGWAWLLQLTAELREWDDTNAKRWLAALEPLEADIVAATKDWMPKLAYPIRLGTHNQSAFAFTLMHDWAVVAGDAEFAAQIDARARDFHLDDVNCPLGYEPSGEDFLSPCLMEADLMRRVLSPSDFADWLSRFLPGIPGDGRADWLPPAIVLDASDGKLVHLDGVNSSRAWNLFNIARALPDDDPRRAALVAAAEVHRDAGVEAVSDEHYSGSHWLASFATYLMTDRGWNE
ncbi:hypothetical protein GCM10007853_01350 [Algimonas ampicilliniresistens]|uniref:DUF2891 domain-containing protein n=1 Tax=Algimonas ampicilliniresistens TaxID=1298735 RepID=A0ABQ5V416_9PROT|nr:DUF2891 domain-containing protein [Algimonas ampicilliniresistens]GLQ22261.1 hypothetical protein GCM10007853_01350 [Algimonas ampicilliniresistens]